MVKSVQDLELQNPFDVRKTLPLAKKECHDNINAQNLPKKKQTFFTTIKLKAIKLSFTGNTRNNKIDLQFRELSDMLREFQIEALPFSSKWRVHCAQNFPEARISTGQHILLWG